MMEQKFHKHDWVQIAKDLGPTMTHFSADREAIVLYSYAEKYGGEDIKSYNLFIKGEGEAAWYYEHQLTLIQSDQLGRLEEWTKKLEEDIAEKGNLNWIFEHGPDVLEKMYGASAQSLAECLGVHDLWGSRGEGIVYYANAITVFALAEPFLKKQDKNGWLKYAEKLSNLLKKKEGGQS